MFGGFGPLVVNLTYPVRFDVDKPSWHTAASEKERPEEVDVGGLVEGCLLDAVRSRIPREHLKDFIGNKDMAISIVWRLRIGVV